MLILRPAGERGHADLGWLKSYHTFSFADYYDPSHMHFRSLRVLNDDRVDPGQGFGMHPHKDMEILTYVLEGSLEHQDSLGTRAVIGAGEVQRISAGTGVFHSEFNPSKSAPVHFLQIWILPEAKGLKPGYEERSFSAEEKRNKRRLIASPQGREGSVTLRQEVEVWATLLEEGAQVEHPLAPGRHAWVHVAVGEAQVNGHPLRAGDGAGISDEETIILKGAESAEVLIFDLA